MPPGDERLEAHPEIFGLKSEAAIRQIVGNDQIVILDNIGLPYSGINIALSDSATVGPMDGEILISLKEKHTSTPSMWQSLRREPAGALPRASVLSSNQPTSPSIRCSISSAVLIDIPVSGPNSNASYDVASKLVRDLKRVPGIVDVHVAQVPDAPALKVDVDRALAGEVGLGQRTLANNLLGDVEQQRPDRAEFLVSPRNAVSYLLVVQAPTY